MSYAEKYSKADVIETRGDIYVPPGYTGETAIIIPDAQVDYCAREFGLTQRKTNSIDVMYGLDPMCGVGTIPRVINSLGGICFGCEMDPERFQAAQQTGTSNYIFEGDFRSIAFNQIRFDYIFTSMPFAWFKNTEAASNLNSGFARDFKKLLNPDGFLLLDSMPEVQREGEVWPVSEMQSRYFEDNGFILDRMVTFDNETHVDRSGSPVVMKFILNN